MEQGGTVRRAAWVTLGRKGRPAHCLHVTLDLGADGKLPTEVRLFRRGANSTRKGVYVFDDAAAELTMAAYAEHGVDVMVDLEHLSLDPDAPNYDPDARAYGRLELRDGELWLVGINWTPDGADRVSTRKQRFVSPAFDVDDQGRVILIFNVAITAQPATDFAMPLAASMTGEPSMNPKLLRLVRDSAEKILALLKDGKSTEDALRTLSIDPKQFQAMAKVLGADASDVTAVIAAVRDWLKEFEDAAAGKKPAEKPADEPAPDAAPQAMRATSTELETLRAEARDQAKQLQALKAERDEREAVERRELVGKLVVLRRETPGTAWEDSTLEPAALRPRGSLRTMPIVELREKVEAFEKLGAIDTSASPVAPKEKGVEIVDGIELGEFEINRIKATAAREGGKPEVAIERYREIKAQQILGAKLNADPRIGLMVSRPLKQEHVLCSATGRPLVTLSTPVKPIEQFGTTAQRALEEFRLEYMATLAALPQVWAETIGNVLSSGALKETYPIDFAVSKYAKRVTENAPARTANSKEISVSKDEYLEAEQCELRRLQRGDFAYLRSWDQKAARMARARQFLRNHLVATLLEANGNWVDAVAFFATTHKVDPFDSDRVFRGSATWSNLQDGTAAPLASDKLTEEKNLFLYSTPGPDGEEMGYEADALLYPTILHQTAKNLLTVQDLILEGAATAPTRNPHFNSGMEMVRAPELAGTAVTANWYLFSRAGIASGLIPWVISEDPSEEVRIWDEQSDFYKGSGLIKYESHVLVSAVLVYPHAMRKVLGT